jgi:hypothetical protein
MIVRALALLAFFAVTLGAGPAAAATKDPGIRFIRAGEPLQIRPDRAYLLLRLDTTPYGFEADLLRVPSATEIDDYERAKSAAYAKAGKKAGPIESFTFDYEGAPNLYALTPNKALEKTGSIATVLAEVPAGEYVVYGQGFAGSFALKGGYLGQCFCLGTVSFSAPAGVVTDMGTMMMDKARETSRFPELAGETGLGPTAQMDIMLFAGALRPRHDGDAVPAGLAATAVRPAQFHAVGRFVELNTGLINRLAPIPGVLAYAEGRVIDVASGKEMPDN